MIARDSRLKRARSTMASVSVLVLAGVVAGSVMAGCATQPVQPAEPPVMVQEPVVEQPKPPVKSESEVASERAKREELEKKQQKLEEWVMRLGVTNRELDDKLARLQLLVLEREAQLKELSRKLEEAILEVVRAKAKLRSIESKAEAASHLAEAEIALNTLKGSAARRRDEDFAQAEEMLKLGALEFKKENYGGALYLTSQVKSLLREGQERSQNRDNVPLLKGEVLFALPLPLQVASEVKAREGPGLEFKELHSLASGEAVLGLSYKGQWVRVKAQDGRAGWIMYTRVAAR